MPNLNKVMLMGNLTRDPEPRYTPKGVAIAEIGLAINRRWKTEGGEVKEEVTFVDVTFWGKQAETINTYCKKGHPIYVEGRLHLDSWDDKDTGKKQYRLRVVGEGFQFLPTGDKSEKPEKSAKSERGEQQQAPAPRSQAPVRKQEGRPLSSLSQDGFDDDEIPF